MRVFRGLVIALEVFLIVESFFMSLLLFGITVSIFERGADSKSFIFMGIATLPFFFVGWGWKLLKATRFEFTLALKNSLVALILVTSIYNLAWLYYSSLTRDGVAVPVFSNRDRMFGTFIPLLVVLVIESFYRWQETKKGTSDHRRQASDGMSHLRKQHFLTKPHQTPKAGEPKSPRHREGKD